MSPSTPTPAGRRRRWRRRLAFGGVGVLVLAATLPWWLGWLVLILGPGMGLGIGELRVSGWWRWECREVALAQEFGRLEAERFTVLQPAGWLVERWWPGRVASAEKPAVDFSGWRVVIAAGAEERAESAEAGTSPPVVLGQTHALLRRLARWLREARGTQGVIEAGGMEVRAPELRWRSGRIEATAEVDGWQAPIGLSADLVGADGMRIEMVSGGDRLRLRLRREGRADDWAAESDLAAAGLTGELEARWRAGESGPEAAALQWRIERWPEEWLARPAFIATLGGGGTVRWEGDRGSAELRVEADLALPGVPAGRSALEVAASVERDPWRLDLRTLRLTAPGLVLRLPAVAGIALTPPFRWRPASVELGLEVDPAPWTAGEWQGRLDGRMAARWDLTNRFPTATFRLGAEALRWQRRLIGPLAVEGRFDWPWVRLDRFQVGRPERGLVASGAWNVEAGRIAGGRWRLGGLPEDFAEATPVAAVQGEGSVEGPLDRLAHRGRLDVRLRATGAVKPLAGALEWTGVAGRIASWCGRVASDRAEWRLAGSGEIGLPPQLGVAVRLAQADWVRGDETVVALARPGVLRAAREEAGWSVAAEPLEWRGGGRRFEMGGRWRETGEAEVRLGAEGWDLAELADWMVSPPVDLGLGRLNLTAGWTNGPVAFGLDLAGGGRPPDRPAVEVALRADADPEGVAIRELAVRLGGELVAEGEGRAPAVLVADETGLRPEWPEAGQWRIRLASRPDAAVWKRLPAMLGTEVEEPGLSLEIEGPARCPAARLRLAAGRLRALNQWRGFELPVLEQLSLALELSPSNQVHVNLGSLVAGQTLKFEATAPGPAEWAVPDRWTDLIPPPEKWSGRLRLDRWALEPLLRGEAARPWLAPAGELEADVRLAPGLQLAGHVVFTNLATQPVPPLGVVRRVHGTLNLAGDRVELRQAGAMLGSQPVQLEGEWAPGPTLPGRLALHLQGNMLPVIRQPDLILRAAPDLWLRAESATNAVISGEVTLQRSLLLRDLASLISPDVTTPAARPPYFRIDTPPFRDWKLAVAIRGEEFLQVVTPVFRGRVSAVMQMAGTLGDPLLTGDVTVPSGTLLFPFGALRVESGRASLSQSDPHMPQLSLRAVGLNFGYQVQMEVTGPAAEPKVFFSSVPPLSSMQILLMLTSGDIPGEAFSYSSRGRMQQIGMFLGKEFLGRLTGDPEDDRLTIRSGQEVSDRGQLTYEIEYRLSDRWSLFGARDRFDSYDGGVKWRVYSK